MRDLHPTDLNRPRRHRGGSSHCRRRRCARCGDRQAPLDWSVGKLRCEASPSSQPD
jgi:hypothetical protein